ncbi:hypothetical protein ACJ3XI_00805 [Litorimonas sp. RW-G-Af-16]|uniref:hypothetical protein n=1 Tax=Litorimonas sp. RW-G-Af-16 TaxID=3241168 RepID=UPI00390CA6B8
MRYLLLGAAAIALSGCSFLGLGGHSDYAQYNANTGYHGTHSQTQVATNRGGCQTGQCLARWNIEGGIGPSFVAGGTAVTADNTHSLPNTAINEIKMKDVYDTGWRAELGGSYALSPNRKVTAMGFIDEADSAGPQNWGTVNGQQLTGALSDYNSYGAEIGLRQYFAPRNGIILKSVRPYVEGRLGATHVDDIRIQDTQLGGAVFSAADVPFYESGWAGSAAGLVGVETPIARYATIGLETGVRYTQGPKSDNSAIAADSPLAGSNNGASRTTIPVMLRGRYRF